MKNLIIKCWQKCCEILDKNKKLFLDKLEADASRSRESLTPPSLKPAYKIEINHDEDSGEIENRREMKLLNEEKLFIIMSEMKIYILICLICPLPSTCFIQIFYRPMKMMKMNKKFSSFSLNSKRYQVNCHKFLLINHSNVEF